MRLSCNGCRVLRKACGEDCIIRPCLSWMRNPESQAHATQFLAKFYGRAGLQNLLHAGSPNHRPAIYRSLLYEACGRIINPTFGSVGLLWSGKWELCQAAVEAVLKGLPISQVSSDDLVESSSSSPSKYPGDIRHAMKDPDQNKLHKISNTTRTKFKRYASKPNLLNTEFTFVNDGSSIDFTEIIESSPSESELCYRPIKDEPEQEEHDQEHEHGQKVEEKPQTTIYLNLGFDQVARIHNPKMYDVDLNL